MYSGKEAVEHPTQTFNIEGVLGTELDSVNLQRFAVGSKAAKKYLYAVGFPGFSITFLGLPITAGASNSHLVAFANPGVEGEKPPTSGNLVWFLAADNGESGFNWSVSTLFLSAGMVLRSKPAETEIVEAALGRLQAADKESPEEFAEAIYEAEETGNLAYA